MKVKAKFSILSAHLLATDPPGEDTFYGDQTLVIPKGAIGELQESQTLPIDWLGEFGTCQVLVVFPAGSTNELYTGDKTDFEDLWWLPLHWLEVMS